jgi:hypothetical protein
MKEKNTKVEPVSFCNKIMARGAKIIADEMYWSLRFFSKFRLHRKLVQVESSISLL